MFGRIGLRGSPVLWLFVIGLIASTGGLGYAAWQAKQSLRTIIGLHFQELARHSADKVNLLLAKEIEWVERFGVLPQVQEAARRGVRLRLDDPAFHRWRDEQAAYFRSLTVLDRTGRLLGGQTSEATRVHYSQQPWWSPVLDQAKSWAGDLRVDEQGRGYWEVAVPIRAEDDASVLSVLKVAIGTDTLLGPALRTRIGRTGHLMVLSAGGEALICHVMPPGLHRRMDPPLLDTRVSRDLLQNAVWRDVREDGHGARGAVVGLAPILLPAPIAQERVWFVMVRQDPAETYEPAYKLLWKVAGFWAGAIGLLVWLGTKLVDLRKLKQAHTMMTRSEEHYRTLWNHAVDAKFILDRMATIRDANRRAELALGRQRTSLIGTDAPEIFAESDRLRFRRLFDEVRANGGPGAVGDVHVPTADQAVLTMDLDLLPIAHGWEGGAFLLQLSDVTEKIRLAEQLVKSERLASLSQFASVFAHDIRNPLAAMKKTLELLSRDERLRGNPTGRLVDDLHFTTELLLGMIHDMLDVYQENYAGLPLARTMFSARLLLHDVARLFKSEADSKGVMIQVEVSDEDLMVMADRRRLQRVIMNLLHNALKFAPPASKVILSAGHGSRPSLAVSNRDAEKRVLLQVEDEGPGIDPTDLPQLFDLFFRKKDGRDPRIGRGLGLHFCRVVVEAHGGRIRAENRPAGGARFSVLIPVMVEAAAEGTSVCRSHLS